jgi:methionine--tRNA ligase beta chain
MITYDDFQKLEIKIGTITSAEKVEGADKLLRLTVDLGEETRQIVAGLAIAYPDPQLLVDKQVPILTNLEPRMLRGIESQGMVLCASDGEKPVILNPETEIPNGSVVK